VIIEIWKSKTLPFPVQDGSIELKRIEFGLMIIRQIRLSLPVKFPPDSWSKAKIYVLCKSLNVVSWKKENFGLSYDYQLPKPYMQQGLACHPDPGSVYRDPLFGPILIF
jgi:hypothetical protein